MGPKAGAKGASGVIVVWSPRAITHLAHLCAYIARDNPNAAGRIASTLLAAVERLAELPNLGRPGSLIFNV
jgi:plasmid stabilization system protein ParE